jgi:hypothetical protein
MNYEADKARQDSKINTLETRAKLVEEYEKKLEEMDFLIEEVDIKE